MDSLTARRNMTFGQLITNEVLDPRIIDAMEYIPREMFVPDNLQESAYVDEDLDVGNGRFLMAPVTFARLLHLANITPTSRVLNIGALSGYTAAVISRLAGHVVATETDPYLIEHMVANLDYLGASNVDVQRVGMLADGYATSAPYNVIIIAGAVSVIPEVLGMQFALDGRLAAVRQVSHRPGYRGGLGKGMLVKRVNNQLHYREHFDAPASATPGFERSPGFRF